MIAESAPKTEEVIYSKANQLSSLNNVGSQAVGSIGSLATKKILIITAISVAVVAASATVVGVYVSKSSEEEEVQAPKNYTKEEFYSERTKSYLNLINNLENENSLLYHWNLELNQDKQAKFKNKYANLYNYSTDLNPRNETIGYDLYKPENYRIIDTDLKKYYQAINETQPEHLVYGPSINGKEYAQEQTLFSDTIKLGKENKNGITISFNLKKGDNFENLNSGRFFGFSTKNEKGLNVGIYYGAIRFYAGGYGNTYDYQDGVKLGYDEDDPYIISPKIIKTII